jgi:hypothetical protein
LTSHQHEHASRCQVANLRVGHVGQRPTLSEKNMSTGPLVFAETQLRLPCECPRFPVESVESALISFVLDPPALACAGQRGCLRSWRGPHVAHDRRRTRSAFCRQLRLSTTELSFVNHPQALGRTHARSVDQCGLTRWLTCAHMNSYWRLDEPPPLTGLDVRRR